MKAKIDGIELEGTPEEILSYQQSHKFWDILNKPVPVIKSEESPSPNTDMNI